MTNTTASMVTVEWLEAMGDEHLCRTVIETVKRVFPSVRGLQEVESSEPLEAHATLRILFPLIVGSIERKGISVAADGTVKLDGMEVEIEGLVSRELTRFPELKVLETAAQVLQYLPMRTAFKNAFRINLGVFVSAYKGVQTYQKTGKSAKGRRRAVVPCR